MLNWLELRRNLIFIESYLYFGFINEVLNIYNLKISCRMVPMALKDLILMFRYVDHFLHDMDCARELAVRRF